MQRNWNIVAPNCQRVLVLMVDYHLGDFTIALPVIEALAAYFEHGIDLAVFHSHAPLVSLLPSAAKIRVRPYITQKKKRNWHQHWNFLTLSLGILRRRYEVVFSLGGRPPCAMLSLISLARHRIGTPTARYRAAYNDIPPTQSGAHRLDSMTGVLQRIGLDGRPPLCRLILPEAALARARTLIREHFGTEHDFVVIHPTAGKVCRQWPVDRFAQVAQALISDRGLPVVLVGTPGERDYLQAVQQKIDRPKSTALVTESLDVTLALLRHCKLFVCNFSGPTHLAGLTTDAPIVCISGPTDKKYWALLSNPHVIMLSGPICPPRCKKDNCTNGMVCIRDVTVEDVLAAIHDKCKS